VSLLFLFPPALLLAGPCVFLNLDLMYVKLGLYCRIYPLRYADALSAKRQETLRNDAHNLNRAISRRTQREVFAIARKALTDLATTSLEERLGEVFSRRWQVRVSP